MASEQDEHLERLTRVEENQKNMQTTLDKVEIKIDRILDSIEGIKGDVIKRQEYETKHQVICGDVDKLKRFMYIAIGGLFVLEFVITIIAYIARK
jgi:hypothetical protein